MLSLCKFGIWHLAVGIWHPASGIGASSVAATRERHVGASGFGVGTSTVSLVPEQGRVTASGFGVGTSSVSLVTGLELMPPQSGDGPPIVDMSQGTALVDDSTDNLLIDWSQ